MLRNPLLAAVAVLPIAAFAINAASADDAGNPPETTIVVSATKTPTPISQVTSSVTVITAKQLAQTGQPFVLDALEDVPGVFVLQYGGPGEPAQVYLRGSAPGDTLVLLDGVPLNDPSSTDRSYDFSNLTVDNIDRIEILRGSQSTLYGSDATGGVINIITKRGKGKPKTSIKAEGGSFKTADGHIQSAGTAGSWSYSAAASQLYTGGYPQAALQSGDGEDDSYRNTTFSGRVDKAVSDTLNLDFTGRYMDGSDHYPGQSLTYLAQDDGLHRENTEQITLRGQAEWTPIGRFSSTAGVSVDTINRDYLDDAVNPALDGNPNGPSNYNGRIYKGDWQGNYRANSANLFTGGAEWEEDEAKDLSAYGAVNPASQNTGSLYGQDQITISPVWFAAAGLRLDDYTSFGKQATYHAGTDYHIKSSGTIIRADYATGFKAPSLYQLYVPYSGNPNLKPETSKSFEAGLEQPVLNDRGAVSATYFDNKYSQLIEYYGSSYTNIYETETSGCELELSYKVAAQWNADFNYTYAHITNDSGSPLYDRPGHQYNASLDYSGVRKLNLSATLQYVGNRLDYGGENTTTFATINANDPSYTLVNVAAQYRITQKYEVFARIDNLTNIDYQPVYSYQGPSRAIYGGVSADF